MPSSDSPAVFGPLRYPAFRNIWCGSVISNLGTLIQSVGAAWAMTGLTSNADKVAMVQTAIFLPTMCFAIIAGALADLYDRRMVALAAMCLGLAGSTALGVIALTGAMSPNVLLAFCFLAGIAITLFAPAWQSSVREQVPLEQVPAAVALNSISYNLGRTLGPAVGGMIVALFGAFAAFFTNAISYIPMIAILLLWKRPAVARTGPREGLANAVTLGVTYVLNAPTIRRVLARVILNAFGNSAVLALLPLVASRLLRSGAMTYGLILGAFGAGAVLGALSLQFVRRYLDTEQSIRMTAITIGCSLVVMAFSPWPWLTALAALPAGMSWTIATSTFQVAVQFSAAGWVVGRAIATVQTAVAGGIAIGSWFWGSIAEGTGLVPALVIAGCYTAFVQLVGLRFRLPDVSASDDKDPDLSPDPAVRFPIDRRIGPITILVSYRIALNDTAALMQLMKDVRQVRRRNGASGWMLSRDMVDPELWRERYRFSTWHDYLRFRTRYTMADRAVMARLVALHQGEKRPAVQRLWDHADETVEPFALNQSQVGTLP